MCDEWTWIVWNDLNSVLDKLFFQNRVRKSCKNARYSLLPSAVHHAHAPFMPPSLLAPPTRREVTLALFGLCVFVLAYNIDSSARAPTSGQPDFLSAKADPNLYTDAALVLEHDGRRPPGWRDALEEQIMGSWAWSAGSVADGIGRPPEGEGSRYMEHAIWGPRMQQALNYHGAAAGMKPGVGPAKQDDGVFRWGKNGLETKVLKHIPGESWVISTLSHTC